MVTHGSLTQSQRVGNVSDCAAALNFAQNICLALGQ